VGGNEAESEEVGAKCEETVAGGKGRCALDDEGDETIQVVAGLPYRGEAAIDYWADCQVTI
jgi:hypothetical protein